METALIRVIFPCFLIRRESFTMEGAPTTGEQARREVSRLVVVEPRGLANAIIILISMVFNKGAHCTACTGGLPTLEPTIQTCMR